MAADNVKTAFCIPKGINKGFIRNLIRQQQKEEKQQQKIINQKQQNISQFASEGVSKYTQENTCTEVSFQ